MQRARPTVVVVPETAEATPVAPQPQDGRRDQEEMSCPASVPASAGESAGKPWKALGARGDTAATLVPQQWESAKPSATATALAAALDARDARLTVMESPSALETPGKQTELDETSEQGQKAPGQEEWLVPSRTGSKAATAAA